MRGGGANYIIVSNLNAPPHTCKGGYVVVFAMGAYCCHPLPPPPLLPIVISLVIPSSLLSHHHHPVLVPSSLSLSLLLSSCHCCCCPIVIVLRVEECKDLIPVADIHQGYNDSSAIGICYCQGKGAIFAPSAAVAACRFRV